MKLLRTYYLYISSKKRNMGDPFSYDVIIPDLLLESENDKEIIKVSMLDFSCYFNWYIINDDGFDTITFHNDITDTSTSIQIPEGNYSYQGLAQKITQLYPACICQWDKVKNKMVFQFNQQHTLMFDGVYSVLGFDVGATPSGTTIYSTNPMRPLETTHLVVNVNNLPPYNDALTLDNLGGHIRPSNILGCVYINAPPFHLVHYQNPTDNNYGVFTSDTKLNRLSIEITNQDGVLLTYIPDHYMTLKVEVFEIVDTQYNELCERIDQIATTLNFLKLNKALKFPPMMPR